MPENVGDYEKIEDRFQMQQYALLVNIVLHLQRWKDDEDLV